jgi:uncharacterized membrane protein (UPF0127 family)
MRYLVLVALLPLISCGPKPTSLQDFPTRPVTLPGGQVIRVETMIETFELMRGMMFRTSLAPDRGMLFVYPKPTPHQLWMYQTLIPLDFIWLDSKRRIVEIVENAPPCKTKASKCQQYGGKQVSSYALELLGGMSKKYGLQEGQTLQW